MKILINFEFQELPIVILQMLIYCFQRHDLKQRSPKYKQNYLSMEASQLFH